MTTIQQLHTDLAQALKAADEAIYEYAKADVAYGEKMKAVIEQFEKDNPELTNARNEAKVKADEAKSKASELRTQAVETLRQEFADQLAAGELDRKPANGFSVRLNKAPRYNANEFFKAAVERKLSCFLMLDEKAIASFVTANAVSGDQKDRYVMPDYIERWLPELQVETSITPTISDSTLLKEANLISVGELTPS